MRHQWLAYVIVAVLSIGAGVAIAGVPDNVAVDPTIIPPPTTDEPAAGTTDVATTSAATTEPEATAPDTTEPEATAPDTTESPTTTEAPTTTDTPDTTEPVPALPERSEIVTVSANGANVAGTATLWSELLEDLGYANVQPRDGTLVVDLSVIYYADGFEQAAVRLAEDMLLLPQFVAPLVEAPNVLDLPDDVELLAYVGLDRA